MNSTINNNNTMSMLMNDAADEDLPVIGSLYDQDDWDEDMMLVVKDHDDQTTTACAAQMPPTEDTKVLLAQWQNDGFAPAMEGSADVTTPLARPNLVVDDDDMDIMQVDEQIGSNLLGDEMFLGTEAEAVEEDDTHTSDRIHFTTSAPSSQQELFVDPPLEALELLLQEDLDVNDVDRFSLSFLQDVDSVNVVDPTKDNDDKAEPTALGAAPADKDTNIMDAQFICNTWNKLAASMKKSKATRKSLTLSSNKGVTDQYARRQSVYGVLHSIEQSSQQIHNVYWTATAARQA